MTYVWISLFTLLAPTFLLAQGNHRNKSMSSCLTNAQSMGFVSDEYQAVSFATTLKFFTDFPPEVAQQIQRAIDHSTRQDNFQETGFYLLVDRDENNFLLDLYTSDNETWLADALGLETLRPFLTSRPWQNLDHIEHFHTHPPALGPMSMYLSSADISSILRLQKIIATTLGIDVPYVENVIHVMSTFGTARGNVTRVKISPKEVAQARTTIAQRLVSKRQSRRRTIPLPAKTFAPPQEDQDGAYLLGHHDRRQAISEMIKIAMNVETLGKSYEQIIRARQGRLQKLPFCDFRPGPELNPTHAASKFYGVAVALRIRGEVPNWLKMMIELHMKEILQQSTWVAEPQPFHLMIYQNSQTGHITRTSVFFGRGKNDTWLALSRINDTGDVAVVHDWDDVPLSDGDRVFFVELPSFEQLYQLYLTV